MNVQIFGLFLQKRWGYLQPGVAFLRTFLGGYCFVVLFRSSRFFCLAIHCALKLRTVTQRRCSLGLRLLRDFLVQSQCDYWPGSEDDIGVSIF